MLKSFRMSQISPVAQYELLSKRSTDFSLKKTLIYPRKSQPAQCFLHVLHEDTNFLQEAPKGKKNLGLFNLSFMLQEVKTLEKNKRS